MTKEEQEMMDSLSHSVTTLCQAIDPTSTHGPETEKIVAHAKKIRFYVRHVYEAHKQAIRPDKPYFADENIRRLGIGDCLNEPNPGVTLL